MSTTEDATVPQDEAALPEIGALETRGEDQEVADPQFEVVEVEDQMQTFRDEDKPGQAQLETREDEQEVADPQ